jgi:hypothetical protein
MSAVQPFAGVDTTTSKIGFDSIDMDSWSSLHALTLTHYRFVFYFSELIAEVTIRTSFQRVITAWNYRLRFPVAPDLGRDFSGTERRLNVGKPV